MQNIKISNFYISLNNLHKVNLESLLKYTSKIPKYRKKIVNLTEKSVAKITIPLSSEFGRFK